MNLRAILGGSRVKKKLSAKPRSTSYSSSSSPASSSSLASWPRTRPGVAGSSGAGKRPAAARHSSSSSSRRLHDEDDGAGDCDYFHDDRLPDHGLVRALADDPNLRDVPQAMRHARAHMFDPLPAAGRAWAWAASARPRRSATAPPSRPS